MSKSKSTQSKEKLIDDNRVEDGQAIKIIVGRYKDLYKERYHLPATVNYAWCGKMIKELLKDHSPMGLIRVIELFFEKEDHDKVFHLPNILSAWSVNKYLPMARLDPRLYSYAEEYNK